MLASGTFSRQSSWQRPIHAGHDLVLVDIRSQSVWDASPRPGSHMIRVAVLCCACEEISW